MSTSEEKPNPGVHEIVSVATEVVAELIEEGAEVPEAVSKVSSWLDALVDFEKLVGGKPGEFMEKNDGEAAEFVLAEVWKLLEEALRPSKEKLEARAVKLREKAAKAREDGKTGKQRRLEAKARRKLEKAAKLEG